MKVWLVSEVCMGNSDFIVGIFHSKNKALEAGVNHYRGCTNDPEEKSAEIRQILEEDGCVTFNEDEGVFITEHDVY